MPLDTGSAELWPSDSKPSQPQFCVLQAFLSCDLCSMNIIFISSSFVFFLFLRFAGVGVIMRRPYSIGFVEIVARTPQSVRLSFVSLYLSCYFEWWEEQWCHFALCIKLNRLRIPVRSLTSSIFELNPHSSLVCSVIVFGRSVNCFSINCALFPLCVSLVRTVGLHAADSS